MSDQGLESLKFMQKGEVKKIGLNEVQPKLGGLQAQMDTQVIGPNQITGLQPNVTKKRNTLSTESQ